jgi:hypothetical protein
MSTTNSKVINQVAYLRTTRNFPVDTPQLQEELDKSYLDIANCVNSRVIGIFTVNRPSITGEAWHISQNRQQTLRQVFTFTATTSITHNIQITSIAQFTRCWGSYTDGTNSYGILWGTNVAVAGLLTFYITSTQIVFLVGAGAPALTSGRITLEWLSNP